ncbi:hypothetical protein GCM10027346_35860 [Hymenobacter seoulensis]
MAKQDDIPSVNQVPTAVAPPLEGVGPVATAAGEVGQVEIRWQQRGEEVAPLLEMRAYLSELKDAGVAVGALTWESVGEGQLRGRFPVSYDPGSDRLLELESILQGLKQVRNGLEVVEQHEQTIRRWDRLGPDQQARVVPAAAHVTQAFGVKQWDALSAQLAAVPKHALTLPEQGQQTAAQQRVRQLAQLQGQVSEHVLREGKSLFDIESSGNPASAFLKNFYAHLHGGPKTRQSLEVDYEKTRRELQARLLQPASPAVSPPSGQKQDRKPAVAPGIAAPLAPPPAAGAPPFAVADLPQQVLGSLGLTAEHLEKSGQLTKLLSGQKTNLLPLEVAGAPGQEPVRFAAKMVLHREADTSVTLQLELPQANLIIPNEIGGRRLTPEQRENLERAGNAGLVRGLKDAQGRAYNGFVAVDPAMNQVVVLPESKVSLRDTIAGVPLSPEQSHDLREGKAVALAGMVSGHDGRPFDGTAQVNAARACIEIRPAAHERQQRQVPENKQAAPAQTRTVKATTLKEPAVPAKRRGPRP